MKRIPPFFTRVICCSVIFAATSLQVFAADEELQKLRIATLNISQDDPEALTKLGNLLNHPNMVIRRTAVRSLEKLKEPAIPLLQQTLEKNSDALTRRSAFRALFHLLPADALQKVTELAFQDQDYFVRMAVMEELTGAIASSQPTPWQLALIQSAAKNDEGRISQLASNLLWPYNEPVQSGQLLPEFQDSQLSVVESIPLPLDGWKFQKDPQQSGHLNAWHVGDFDDESWSPIRISQIWQNFGHAYEGVAWYRLNLTLPARPQHDVADLVFEAVDQSAWIWVNGQFAGAHDLGPAGWDKSFAANVTKFLNWDAPNQITVRVSKPSGDHAGIYKPASLELLKK